MKWGDYNTRFNELSAYKAEQDVRRNTLPAEPKAYEPKLSADFKAPEGVNFELDAADPLMAQAQQLAHDWDSGKISGQAAFSKLLDLHAAGQVGQAQMLKAGHDAEIAKLGPAGPARVDAVRTWIAAKLGGDDAVKAIMPSIVLASQVEVWERVVKAFSSQGAGPFNAGGREPSAASNGAIPGYANMTFEQRRAAQEAQRGGAR